MMAGWRMLLLGGALILLANGVALTGVYLNRSGEPESRLLLSQRELGHPWGWRNHKENSGLALNLQWRVVDAYSADREEAYPYVGNYGGSPPWLDEARMAELGFDVQAIKAGGEEGSYSRRRQFEHQLEREVLVVLELAGPAWDQAQERARRHLTKQVALREASPDAKEFIEREKRARELLQQEETQHTRLFAIDAGLDLAALRARYPDRSRYMILRGKVQPRLTTRDKKTLAAGYLGQLLSTQINVPHALRPGFEAVLQQPSRQSRVSEQEARAFTVSLSVGRRLEPWLSEAPIRQTFMMDNPQRPE